MTKLKFKNVKSRLIFTFNKVSLKFKHLLRMFLHWKKNGRFLIRFVPTQHTKGRHHNVPYLKEVSVVNGVVDTKYEAAAKQVMKCANGCRGRLQESHDAGRV
jgi:hypothetical protein